MKHNLAARLWAPLEQERRSVVAVRCEANVGYGVDVFRDSYGAAVGKADGGDIKGALVDQFYPVMQTLLHEPSLTALLARFSAWVLVFWRVGRADSLLDVDVDCSWDAVWQYGLSFPPILAARGFSILRHRPSR